MTPRERAATALRQLGHALVGHEVDEDRLTNLAAAAEGWLATVAAGPVRRRPSDGVVADVVDGDSPADGQPVEHFADCPISGPDNPFSLSVTALRDGQGVVGEAVLGSAHEGAPGRSHGGVVAALFDDIFGFLTGVVGLTTYAGSLSVRYRRPTPLNEPLDFTCTLGEREGRRQHARAELRHRGTVVAEASVVMVVIPPDEMTRATYDP